MISFIITTDQIEKDEFNEKEIITMPVDIKNVLVCDAVDDSCIQLLKQNGINVIFLFSFLLEYIFSQISYLHAFCCFCCFYSVSLSFQYMNKFTNQPVFLPESFYMHFEEEKKFSKYSNNHLYYNYFLHVYE